MLLKKIQELLYMYKIEPEFITFDKKEGEINIKLRTSEKVLEHNSGIVENF